MITICFTYFKSLTLANLAAALWSVRQQDLLRVGSIVVVNNDTADPKETIQAEIDALKFPIPVQLLSFKHGDSLRTHAWSTNVAVKQATTPWVLFTRADYLLDFTLVKRFVECVELTPDWNGFVTSNGCHLSSDIAACEQTLWREQGPRVFHGVDYDYTEIDAGVWMARRDAFDHVGGLDERLSAWGHAQTEFQYRMHVAGVEFVKIPETLFYHPAHGYEAPKDIELAHRQLKDCGFDIRQMWARYEGVNPYASL